MIEKFLVMQTAANDVMVYPVSRIKGMEGKDGTVDISFETVGADDVLTINTSDEFQAIQDIAEAIGGNKDGAILLGDDIAGVYASSSITSIGGSV
jgi:hypothetical protein